MTRYTFLHNKCKVGDGVEDDGYKDMIPSQDVTLFVWEGIMVNIGDSYFFTLLTLS